jgi:predicted Zn-dependent protease
MDYSNPEIPEGINVSKTHPLSEFALLTVGVFGTVIVIALILSFFADKFAHYIPYRYESSININYAFEAYDNPQLQQYIQSLADKIATAEQLPEEMRINISVVESDTVNAFASLDGQVVFFTGLLKKIPNENALAMVIAHEIAHIKLRHPIRSLGRGIVLGLFVTIFSSSIGNDIVSSSIGDVSFISQLKFSRSNEEEADAKALEALQQIYGHVNGAEDLFKILKEQESSHQVPEFFSTHPYTDGRIQRIVLTNQNAGGNEASRTELPQQYKAWMKQPESNPKLDTECELVF